MRQIGSGLVIARVVERKDVVTLISALKNWTPLIRSRKLRVVIMTPIKHNDVLKKFQEYGAAEIIIDPQTEKALDLKMKRHLQMAVRSRENEKLASRTVDKRGATGAKKAGLGAGTGAGQDAAKATFKYVDALSIETDFWLMLSQTPRRVLGKWLITLTGPSPTIGRWVENGNEQWKWDPIQKEKDPFIKSPGMWVFKGQRPEVRGETWVFVGRKAELIWVTPDGGLATKFSTDEGGNLNVAKDSNAGLGMLALIRSTWDKILKKSAEGTGAEAAEKVVSDEELAARGDAAADSETKITGRAKRDQDEEDQSPEELMAQAGEGETSGELSEAGGTWSGGKKKKKRRSLEEGADASSETEQEESDGSPAELQSETYIAKKKFEEGSTYQEQPDAPNSGQKDPASAADLVYREKVGDGGTELNGRFKDESKPGTELNGTFANDRKDSKELEATQSATVGTELDYREKKKALADGLTGSITQDGKPVSPELSAAIEEVAGRALEYADKKNAAGTELNGSFAKEDPAGEFNDAQSGAKDAERNRGGGFSTAPAPVKAERAPLDGSGLRPDGTKIQRVELSLLALAFMQSELSTKTGRPIREIGNKFCEYLNCALGGVAVEIWKVQGDGTSPVCLASDQGGKGDFDSAAEKLLAGTSQLQSLGEYESGIWIVPGVAVVFQVPRGAPLPSAYIAGVIPILNGLGRALAA